MPRSPSDSTAVVGALTGTDDGLLLPRPPGVLRRFWARHPRITDVLVALVAFLLSAPAATIRSDAPVAPSTGETWFAIALVVLMSAALVLRRRHPLLVFALTMVPVLILAPSLSPVAHLLPAFAIYAVAVYRSVRACWIAFAAASGALVVYTLVAWATVPVELGFLVTSQISAIVALLLGALIGINVGNRRRYLEALIDRSRQLLVERDQQAQLAAAGERARIAREMHDIVSHNLTVVVALAEGAAATPDPDRARTAAQQIAATARGALTEMRAMLGVLRAPGAAIEHPLAPAGSEGVAEAVEAAQRAGFPVVLRSEGRWEDAPAETRFAVTRIVQESLTNAMRHARLATCIEVHLATGDAGIDLTIVNDGVRGDADAVSARGGFGLVGLRERVTHVGGTLQAGAAGGGRWLVRASLPWDPTTSRATKETTP
ncbi:sensor histidine kinase [Microbacterium timonense]|uniref:sensor histidine kinase n=1 Tax=Microbacterium timonense TaxID=2086576 RepID=UPI000D106478|nr:histidine kinase [Microbacterium timonense]